MAWNEIPKSKADGFCASIGSKPSIPSVPIDVVMPPNGPVLNKAIGLRVEVIHGLFEGVRNSNAKEKIECEFILDGERFTCTYEQLKDALSLLAKPNALSDRDS